MPDNSPPRRSWLLSLVAIVCAVLMIAGAYATIFLRVEPTLLYWKIGPVTLHTASSGLAVMTISATLLYLLLRPSLGRIEVFSLVDVATQKRRMVQRSIARVVLIIAWIGLLSFLASTLVRG